MALHTPSGRAALGASLALTTVVLWGLLPIALEQVLEQLDAVTLTWVRFTGSAFALGLWLAGRGALPRIRSLGPGHAGLLLVATVFLAVNYIAYLYGLEGTDASSAQVLMQLAPLLLAIGSLAVFRERFDARQWLGVAVLLGGMGIYFATQLRSLAAGLDRYASGALWIVFASTTWAIYGLAQKQLLEKMSSFGLMLCIFGGCSVLFAFGADFAALGALNAAGWAFLAFATANTLVAYTAFAASLAHWEASRTSAVLALSPLATLLFSNLAAFGWPDFYPAAVGSPGAITGAFVVVGGSLLVALGNRGASA